MKIVYFCCVCFIGCFGINLAAEQGKSNCLEKEKALALLETAEDLLSKSGDLFPSCKGNFTSTDKSECEGEKPLAYLEIAKKHISDVRENFPTCPKSIEKDDNIVEYEKPIDCSEHFESGKNVSGVYTVWPREPFTMKKIRKPLEVYCDMETDKGGWTVIQRRGKFPVQQDFYQDWETYKNGFGNLSEEFWFGNENIRTLCLRGCEIRFDLQDVKGVKGFAHYKSFNLSSSNYRIGISDYSGNVGDRMVIHNNLDFATKDQDSDGLATQLKGGWWYRKSYYNTNLNGIYKPGISGEENIIWHDWRKIEGLAGVEIKVRPKKA